jgi:hypothetical protein
MERKVLQRTVSGQHRAAAPSESSIGIGESDRLLSDWKPVDNLEWMQENRQALSEITKQQ